MQQRLQNMWGVLQYRGKPQLTRSVLRRRMVQMFVMFWFVILQMFVMLQILHVISLNFKSLATK